MRTIKVSSREEVSPESQALFDQITKKLGKVPNLYAVIGYSSTTLKGMLMLDAAFRAEVFTPRERECINLVCLKLMNADVALAAHTISAIYHGYNHDETVNIRQVISEKKKLSAAMLLAKCITENRGQA